MNNCGFDWNMKANAIDFEYKDTKPINANDLLYYMILFILLELLKNIIS